MLMGGEASWLAAAAAIPELSFGADDMLDPACKMNIFMLTNCIHSAGRFAFPLKLCLALLAGDSVGIADAQQDKNDQI